jgi:hypothetical protein
MKVFNNNGWERLWNFLVGNVRIYRMKLLKQMAWKMVNLLSIIIC